MSAGMKADAAPRTRTLVLLGWLSIAVSTGAWIAHLLFIVVWVGVQGRGRAGLGSACTTGAVAPFHLATLVTALLALGALAASAFVYREHDRVAPSDPELAGQFRFLGLLGIGTAVFNLVLILFEGSYVLFLRSCG
jgi:hypothetical protein